jgi:DNA-binding LacI/PurR family transcriptional regulator
MPVPKKPGYRPATLADVAASVGLSPAAVSLALRGKPGVSESTRARVVEAARNLRYRPLAGISRQHQKPRTVGLVINAFEDPPEANRFYAPVMAGIEESCRAHRMDLMLATMPVDQHYYPLEVPRIVTDRTCDGLIVVAAHLSSATAEILRTAPPVVLVDAYSEDDAFDSVDSDNIGGARSAVEYLVAKGHREIAVLGTEPQAFPSILQRRRAYEQVIAENGFRPHYIDAPYYLAEMAAAAGIEFLTANPHITAVFCANDAVAVALLQAARQAGIAIPDRLSVVGFDDIDLAGFVSPALTTMAVDKVGMGRIAVTLLAHRLDVGKECVTQTLLKPQLIERQSVRSLSGSAASHAESQPA